MQCHILPITINKITDVILRKIACVFRPFKKNSLKIKDKRKKKGRRIKLLIISFCWSFCIANICHLYALPKFEQPVYLQDCPFSSHLDLHWWDPIIPKEPHNMIKPLWRSCVPKIMNCAMDADKLLWLIVV